MNHVSEVRMRWAPLALLLVAFGILVHSAPTAAGSDGGEATLGQISDPATAALPTPSQTLSADASHEWSTRDHHDDSHPSARPSGRHRPSVSGPSNPDALARTLGGSLLGLPTAPANAPPRG